jgi:hypothetical protein
MRVTRLVIQDGIGIRAAVESVVAGPAVEGVIACTAEDGVISIPAGQEVVTAATIEGIVAAAAVEGVVAPAPQQQVIRSIPGDGVVESGAYHLVEVPVEGQDQPAAHVLGRGIAEIDAEGSAEQAEIQRILPAGNEGNGAGGSAVDDEYIGTQPAICAVAGFVHTGHDDDVIPVSAVERIHSSPAGQGVIAVSAVERIVPGPADQGVIPGAAVDGVVPGSAIENVVAGVAGEGVIAAAACDIFDLAAIHNDGQVAVDDLAAVGGQVDNNGIGGTGEVERIDPAAAGLGQGVDAQRATGVEAVGVVPGAAAQDVIAGAAGQSIVAGSCIDGVAAGAAVDAVITRAAGECVIPRSTGDVLDFGGCQVKGQFGIDDLVAGDAQIDVDGIGGTGEIERICPASCRFDDGIGA